MSGCEFFDVTNQRIDIAGPEGVVSVWVLNEFCTWYLRRKTATKFDGHEGIGSAMEHQCWNTHALKYRRTSIKAFNKRYAL